MGNVSKQTRNNWFADATLFIGAVIAGITGIYFLFLPVGGYQGGRNPYYGITLLFERHTWDELHTWFGALMIAAAAIHFVMHWGWVKGAARRVTRALTGRGPRMNRGSLFNVAVDAAVGVGFLLAAVSGIYFMFVSGGRSAADPMILFSRTTWDLVHTWGAVGMLIAAIVHFAIHWRWVTKVTRNVAGSLRRPLPVRRPAGAAREQGTGSAAGYLS